MINDAPWFARAACRMENGINPELFFPDMSKRDPDTLSAFDEAKLICARCPVKSECLEYALSNDIQYGIWGGLQPSERSRLKKADAL